MKTIIIRKTDFSNLNTWQGILRALDIPEHQLDGDWDDLTLSIFRSRHYKNNTEVLQSYE